jgi:hypothetical protein
MSMPPTTLVIAARVSADLARSALPGAPVVLDEPRNRHAKAVRRRAAAALHRLADAVAPVPASSPSH